MNIIKRDPRIQCYQIMLLSLLVLGGCENNSMDDLNEYIKLTKTKYIGKVEPLPAVEPYENYEYQVADQRDPFRAKVSLVKSITLKKSNASLHPDNARSREGLEAYPLNELSMVGIMVNDGQIWAVIKSPDGTIFRVKKGNYLGKDHGKITTIVETKIEIKELVADGLGGWVKRPNSLMLVQ